MSEETKNTTTEAAQNAQTDKKVPEQPDPTKVLLRLAKGKLELATPIRAESRDITALEYDYEMLTGWEYADALDKDPKAQDAFRLSTKQGLSLFATAAAKVTPGVDATDILQRLGTADAIKAVQLSAIFFAACTRAGNKRITNAPQPQGS